MNQAELIALLLGIVSSLAVSFGALAQSFKLRSEANATKEQREKTESDSEAKTRDFVNDLLKEANLKIAGLEKRIAEMHDHQINHEQEMSKMRDKVDEANKQHNADQARIKELQTENDKRKEENRLTTEQVDALNKQIGELKNVLDAKSAENTRLIEDRQKLAEANAALQLQLTIQQEATKLATREILNEMRVMLTGEMPAVKPEVTEAVAESPAPQTIKEG